MRLMVITWALPVFIETGKLFEDLNVRGGDTHTTPLPPKVFAELSFIN